MKTIFTAIGRFKTKQEGTKSYPVILINGKECVVDLQEAIIWSILNWRLLCLEEIEDMYNDRANKLAFLSERSFQECVSRLLYRGLITSGSGDKDTEALYDLISDLYILPVIGSWGSRITLFLKMVFFRRVSCVVAWQSVRKMRLAPNERRIYQLVSQTLPLLPKLLNAPREAYTASQTKSR